MAKAKKKSAAVVSKAEAKVRAKAEAERIKAAQAAKERRRRLITIGSLVGAVLVVAVVITVVMLSTQSKEWNAVELKPLGAVKSGGIRLGQDLQPGGEAPSGNDVVTVRIYSDFMCPGCGSFDLQNAALLSDLSKNGSIQVEVHTLGILDYIEKSESYSTRAALASFAVAKYDPANYWAFVQALFGDQPTEGQETRTDEQIVQIAQSAGVSEEAREKFRSLEMQPWLDYANAKFQQDGYTGTPTIVLARGDEKGEVWGRVINLEEAIDNVREGRPANG
jgi:protein-disulfide isomerase